MKPIEFTRSDFLQIKHLKFLFTTISIKLHLLLDSNEFLEVFYYSFSNKLQSFLNIYDILCKQISETSLDVNYFTNDLSKLGQECLKEIESIGVFLDDFVQENPIFFKHHFQNIMDEIY